MGLPTEAEMAPGQFGPNQVQGFLQKMLDELLPRWMEKPKFTQFESGEIHVGFRPLHATLPALVIYRDTSGWHLLECAVDGIASYQDPFDLMKEVVRYYAAKSVDEWIFYNYTGAA